MSTQTFNHRTKAMTDLELVRHIMTQYIHPVTKSTDWKRAFREHPEWSPRMSYNSKDIGHHKGRNLRQKLLKQGPYSPGRSNKEGGNGGGQYGLRKMKPKSMELLHFMADHGDKDGYLNIRELNRTMPGWNDKFTSKKWARHLSYQFIRRGTFKKFKAGMAAEASDVPAPHGKNMELSRAMKLSYERRKAQQNGATPFEQDHDAAGRLLVRKEAEEMLMEILEDNSFCSRCGKSLKEQFMAASFKSRFHKHNV